MLPVLGAHRSVFKVARDRHELRRLNDGTYGPTQIGKFVTVYPPDDAAAVALGRDLVVATSGISAPRIPSDRRLHPDAPVYYRFGAFRRRIRQDLLGVVEDVLERPDGTLVPDRRRRLAVVPDWVVDPFEAAGSRIAPPPVSLTVAGRYLLAKSLSPTAVVTIFLAVDTQKGRRTVLKRLPLESGTDRTPDDVVAVLEREARLMRGLEPLRLFPWAADVFVEGDHAFLPMEHLDGEPLPDWIARRFAELGHCPVAEAEAVLASVARAVVALHSRGYVYADLKSEHVFVNPDLSIRLLDAETLLHTDDPFDEPMRTAGYASPQQWAGERPTPADDVHAFGAIVYEVLTGTVAHDAPRPHRLLDLPILDLVPTAPRHLVALAEACLEPERARRPHTGDLHDLIGGRREVERPCTATPSRVDLPTWWRSVDQLLDGVRMHDGRAWWTFPDDAGFVDPYLGNGVAGVAHTLCELAPLVDPARAERIDTLLPLVATWLDEQRPWRDVPLGGLYIGESGIGVALAGIGARLGDHAWTRAGIERIRGTALHELASPDLFHGIGGRLRAHLIAWRASGDRDDLEHAIADARRLLAQLSSSPGSTTWCYPDGHAALSGKHLHGYGHGTAGIADALLDLLTVLDELHDDLAPGDLRARLRRAVATASDGLVAAARPRPFGDAACWSIHLDDPDELAEPHWCHGSTGIARFLLRARRADRRGLLALDVDPGPTIDRAVTAVVDRTQLGPSQCHGLAGSVELLLDAADDAGTADDPADATTIAAAAQRLASLLPSFVGPRDVELDPTWNPSLMTGEAGIVRAIARAARPTSLPTLLSPTDDLIARERGQASPR